MKLTQYLKSPAINTYLRLVLCAWPMVGEVAFHNAAAQSADWQEAVWREPQVRYLLADLCLNGGKSDLYWKHAVEERDPDSREAIRLWDAGIRVVNTNAFVTGNAVTAVS